MVLLVIVAIFIASFSSATEYLPTDTWRETWNYVYNWLFDYIKDTIYFTSTTEVIISDDIDFVCFKRDQTVSNYPQYNLEYSVNNSSWYSVYWNEIGCTDLKTIYFRNWTVNFFYFIDWDWYLKKQYTSLQCQTEYNLIPISSVDQNYCTTNNLCPTCSVCPVGSGWVSTLYINNILHVWSPNIYMTIPEEIWRDYEYTQWGTNMLIDVEWYNVDYEKMQSVIDQQNYKPTQEDFQNLILILWPYSQIILFFVFLFLIWAWIKKPFKSKKI